MSEVLNPFEDSSQVEYSDKRNTKKSRVPVKEIPNGRVLSLIILSVTYLIFELSFSARLLDAVWLAEDAEQIHQLENFGRMLSGFAVWLVIFGLVSLSNGPNRKRNLKLTALSLPFVMIAVAQFQIALINAYTNHASQTELKNAVYATIISQSYKEGEVSFAGFQSSETDSISAAEKTFVGLIPFIATHTPDLDRKVESQIYGIVERLIAKQIGSPQQLYPKVYSEPYKDLKESYNKYAEGSNKLYANLKDIPKIQKDKWEEYRNKVKRKTRYYPEQIRSRWKISRIRKEVRKDLPSLSENWNIADKYSFYRAVRKQARKQMYYEFNSEMMRAGLDNTKPGLSFKQFIALKPVKYQWEDGFKSTIFSSYPPKIGISYQTFVDKSYKPVLHDLTTEKVNELQSLRKRIDKQQTNEQVEAAFQLAIVPIIALTFSLAGAIMHFGKVCNLLMYKFIASALLRTSISVVIIVLLGWYPLTQEITLSSYELYQYLMMNMDFSAYITGSIFPHMFNWVIHLENFFYPISETTRNTVLLGQEFGFKEP